MLRPHPREHLAVRGETVRTGLRPFGLLAMALAWQWGLRRLGLPDESYVILKVAAEFRRDFKIEAAMYGLNQVALLQEMFALWKQQKG